MTARIELSTLEILPEHIRVTVREGPVSLPLFVLSEELRMVTVTSTDEAIAKAIDTNIILGPVSGHAVLTVATSINDRMVRRYIQCDVVARERIPPPELWWTPELDCKQVFTDPMLADGVPPDTWKFYNVGEGNQAVGKLMSNEITLEMHEDYELVLSLQARIEAHRPSDHDLLDLFINGERVKRFNPLPPNPDPEPEDLDAHIEIVRHRLAIDLNSYRGLPMVMEFVWDTVDGLHNKWSNWWVDGLTLKVKGA